MTPLPTPIETSYAGCRFRSRLEARWAVFFDELAIKWRYEVEGFELPSGRYLPDFHLADLGWFEVKGPMPLDEERQYAAELAEATQERVFIAWGDTPFETDHQGRSTDQRSDRGIDLFMGFQDGQRSGDHDYAWCVCPWCGAAGLEYEGRGARIHGFESHGLTEEQAWEAIKDHPNSWRIDDKCYTGDDPQLHIAFIAARSARFEHGQSGAR